MAMKHIYSLLFLSFIISLIGCKPEQKKESKKKEIKEIVTDTIANQENTSKDYTPTDDDIREYGLIEKVEDATYPFFEVTFNFVERNMKMDFNVNIESISLTDRDLNNLQGKYATLYYTSDLVNDLVDLHYEGKTLFGEYAPEMDASWKKITGIMSGAESLSGDLPSKIQVTDSDGQKIVFELYIEDDTMKANGKTVTAYYTLHGVNTVTHIEASED